MNVERREIQSVPERRRERAIRIAEIFAADRFVIRIAQSLSYMQRIKQSIKRKLRYFPSTRRSSLSLEISEKINERKRGKIRDKCSFEDREALYGCGFRRSANLASNLRHCKSALSSPAAIRDSG